MTPAFRLRINGKEASSELLRRLMSLTLHDEAGLKADTVELEIDGRGDVDPPPIGAELRVWVGYEPAPIYKGRFRVNDWTLAGPVQTISVRAVAADLTSEIKATKTRSHHDTTLGDVVKKIAGEHGLSVVIDSALASRRVEHIDQQTESDMGFLSRLAKRNGATFKLGAGRILFTAKGSDTLPDGSDKAVVTITPPQLSDWSATMNERGGHKSVKAAYYDAKLGKRVYCTAGEGGPCHRDKRLYATKEEAQDAADATLGDLTRGKMTAESVPETPTCSRRAW